MQDDLEPLQDWLGDILHNLSPGPRRSLAMKIMRAVRKSNAGRIARNEQPDGSAMTPRKPRKGDKSGRIARKAKMFRQLSFAKNMKIRVDADGGELSFAKGGHIAQINHFGEVAIVGKLRDGRTIKTRYDERKLLGFNQTDRDGIIDAVSDHIEPD